MTEGASGPVKSLVLHEGIAQTALIMPYSPRTFSVVAASK